MNIDLKVRPLRSWRCYLLPAAIAPLLAALRWPWLMSLEVFAFADSGATLTLSRLTRDGLSPGVDFIYQYGILSAALTDVVFHVFGLAPVVHTGLSVVLAAAYAVMVYWAAQALSSSRSTNMLIVVGLVLGTPLPMHNSVHLLEPLLIVLALGLHFRNAPGAALAVLAVTAFFVKPALAYAYGFLMVVEGGLWSLHQYKTGTSLLVSLSKRFLPAAVTSVIVALPLAWRYGLSSVVTTALPFAGMSAYRAERMGLFFGRGQIFWTPEGRNWKYYLGSPIGFWTVATIILLASMILRIGRLQLKQGTSADKNVAICGALHVIFIMVIYGPMGAWRHEFGVLLLGLIGAISQVRYRTAAAYLLSLLAILGTYTAVRGGVHEWRDWRQVSNARGLYAPPPVAEDWMRLVSLTEQERVFVFSMLGAADLIDPRLSVPDSWCLYWWNAKPAEVASVRAKLEIADVVAVPRFQNHHLPGTLPVHSSLFREDLAVFSEREDWTNYVIMRRPKNAERARNPMPRP